LSRKFGVHLIGQSYGVVRTGSILSLPRQIIIGCSIFPV
jgi:hypothetical protein